MKWLVIIVTALLALVIAKQNGFRERPQNVTQIIGSDVTLRCAAYPSGTEHDLHSQWKSNTGALLGFRHAGTLPGHGGRYNYIRDSPDELHLRIERLELDDDGSYECQMVRQGIGPLRAAAAINVVVPPAEVSFLNYKEGTVLELQEDGVLNVTCVSPNGKPAPRLSWFLNGKLVTSQVHLWEEVNPNKTVIAYATMTLRPTKSEHNKMLTCESFHNETGTKLRTSVTLHVLYSSERPKIDVASGTSNIKAGQNLTLVCSAKGGNPPPNLSWFLNDRPIGTLYSYDFSNQITRNEYSFIVEASDNGAVYECRSSNRPSVPALRKSITLTVKYPAANVFLYGNSTIRRGEQMNLSCVSSPSNPPSVISWTLNEAPMRPQPQAEKRMTAGIATESNMTIDSNTALSGQKEIVAVCSASNEEGTISQRHVIRVLIPPGKPYIYGAETGPSLEGENLNLTCETVGGNPPAHITWYRGQERLREAHATVTGELSSSSVTIKLDRSMNNMPLRCEADNGALEEPFIASKTLSVLFPPKRLILRQPENDRQQMISGEPARLSCTVPSSNPPAEISWKFERSVNPSGRLYTLSLNRTERSHEFGGWETKQVITFTADEKLDGSAVQCIASHPLWNDVVAAEHKLSIFYPPRVASQGPISVDIEEGSSFHKNLSIISNPPISGWRWRKNGVTFENTIGSIYARGSIIGARAVGSADSGIYTLLASNLFGTVNVTLNLVVRYPARIVYITSPVIASVGEDVVLECEADGVPQISNMVKWMRGDTVLRSITQERKRTVLRLNASHDTSGAYTCVADNGIGSANYSTAYLLVKKPPQILRNPGHDRAAGPIGGRAKVVCQAIGVPDAAFQWSLEGENNVIQYNSTKYMVHETQLDYTNFESTLWIMDLNEMDYSRRVRCRAMNQMGHDSIYITVSTPSAPDVPTSLEVLRVTNHSVTLGWMPGFDGGADQIFELRIQMNGGKAYSLNFSRPQAVITNLQPATTYHVQIRSVNEHHRVSEFSLPTVEIHTLDQHGMDVQHPASSTFNSNILILIAIVVLILVLVNLIIFCYIQRRDKRKLHEKTEYARTTLINANEANVRPVQMYGAVGTPMARRRPDSTNTNRSELLNDRASEDDQSVRTMIEVSPNGCMQRYDPNCVVDYEFNPDLYSCINRNVLDVHGITYAAMPYPEPPQGGEPTPYHLGPAANYAAVEQNEMFGYSNRHPDVLVGGASGMSNIRRSSLTNKSHGKGNGRHDSPALTTFIPSGGVRTTTGDTLNGDLV